MIQHGPGSDARKFRIAFLEGRLLIWHMQRRHGEDGGAQHGRGSSHRCQVLVHEDYAVPEVMVQVQHAGEIGEEFFGFLDGYHVASGDEV